jgi:signal transduction histidine kinase
VAHTSGSTRSVRHVIRTVKISSLVVDISIAAICFLVRVAITPSDPLIVIVTLGMAAAIAVNRLSPAIALGVAWVTVVIQLAAQVGPDISNAAVLIVLFATAAYGSRTVRWAGFVSAFLGAFVATLYVTFSLGVVGALDWSQLTSTILTSFSRGAIVFLIGFVASLVLFLLSWTVGLLWKTIIDAQAAGRARVRAEKEQESAQRDVAIEQERTRIARDMHDVVAHSLAVVIAQADGARYAAKKDPTATDAALTTISATAREALSDVRMLLGQLRHSQTDGPQPMLADLDRLIEQFSAAGLDVRHTATGTAGQLGTAQQLATYRIVQESLTNALRHADITAPVVVAFDWTEGELDLSIVSAIGESEKHPHGHGIDGMRERAILAGGSLTAEPRGDQFVVTATLPASAVVSDTAPLAGEAS